MPKTKFFPLLLTFLINSPFILLLRKASVFFLFERGLERFELHLRANIGLNLSPLREKLANKRKAKQSHLGFIEALLARSFRMINFDEKNLNNDLLIILLLTKKFGEEGDFELKIWGLHFFVMKPQSMRLKLIFRDQNFKQRHPNARRDANDSFCLFIYRRKKRFDE